MIRVTCINRQCPGKSFLWNELSELGSLHDLAQPNEVGAVRVVALCTYCSTENAIWVKVAGLKKANLTRGRNSDKE